MEHSLSLQPPYDIGSVQMKFLRLSSAHVRQIVILHCHDDGANEVLTGRNFTVLGAPHTRLVQSRVLENDCLVSHTVYVSVCLCIDMCISGSHGSNCTHMCISGSHGSNCMRILLVVLQGCHFNVFDALSVALCSSQPFLSFLRGHLDK